MLLETYTLYASNCVEYLMKTDLPNLFDVILRPSGTYSDVCFPKLDARLGRTKIL